MEVNELAQKKLKFVSTSCFGKITSWLEQLHRNMAAHTQYFILTLEAIAMFSAHMVVSLLFPLIRWCLKLES
jgi:hypothetical protein